MPRIAKWKEKSKCVDFLKNKTVKFCFDDTTPLGVVYETLYDLIDKTIEEAVNRGLQYDQLVDVKEVPYG